MPINTVSEYVLGLLSDLPLPGPVGAAGNLSCLITPPDPGLLIVPTAYLWPSTGDETRLASPRAGGPQVVVPGWKKIAHQLDLFVAYVGAADDPAADTNFPAVLDAIMAALRPSPDEVLIPDPVTGIITSVIIGVGEHMTYDVSVLHTLEDQRYLRYTAKLTLPVSEYFQA